MPPAKRSTGLALSIALHVFLGSTARAADPAPRIDFARQVEPLFREHCVRCHGPSEQMAGLRLDQRGSVLKTRARRVLPGYSETSRLYLKVASADFGEQMPPDGPLDPADVAILKDWIDQGAEWPDALSGDPPPPPPADADATRLMDALRTGDRAAVRRLLDRDETAVRRQGPDGATPLMYAVLHGDAGDVRRMLALGADPNVANHAGATALMWAVDDLEKTRLLLDHRADPNARAPQGQTPLSIASGRFGSRPVVALLIEHGARAAQGPQGEGALIQAADAGDAEVFRLLLAHGAPVKAPRALAAALRSGCGSCAEAVIGSAGRDGLDTALVLLAPFGELATMRMLLDHGADVDARPTRIRRDFKGRTPLLLAASSDVVPTDAVRLLVERGARLDARGPEGETALDLAKRNGSTAVVSLLERAGVRETAAFPGQSTEPRPVALPTAVARSLPLLQRSDEAFMRKAGCVSCHHNSLTAMTVAAARAHRVPVDDALARFADANSALLLGGQREDALLGAVITNTASGVLAGLAALGHLPDATTDAMARLIEGRQRGDGRWRNAFVDHRPPIQGSDIELTASSLRALRAYAPRTRRAAFERAIRRGTEWLLRARPATTDEEAMKILGLRWAGTLARHAVVRETARTLLAEQRPDGGWAQLPTLASDAHATGQALVALREADALPVGADQRGVRFLLDTQLADGSWYVKTRSLAFQPYFESGFPHGPDQWISMAATNWATMALASTRPALLSP